MTLFKKLGYIQKGGFGNVVQRLLGKKGLVGGHQNVWHGNKPRQSVVVHDILGSVLEKQIGLLLINVKTSAADVTGFDSPEQNSCVNKGSSRGVDYNDFLFKFFDRVFVDHVPCFLG